MRARTSEVTPLVINGVMYLTTPYNRVVALEPETGKEIWKYELRDLGAPATRGLTYWPGDKLAPPTLFFGTTGGYLVAINVKTGKACAGLRKRRCAEPPDRDDGKLSQCSLRPFVTTSNL